MTKLNGEIINLQAKLLNEKYNFSIVTHMLKRRIFIYRDLIDSVVAVAENTADELIRNQGQDVTLEEDPQLQLPFLLPEDRYSSEVIRGVPPGLKEFLNPLAGIGKS